MTSSGWVCPACRRRFARAKQAHSCQRQTIGSHFSGKDPQLRKVFDELVTQLEQSGPLRVDAVKTSIHLISRHHFGGISVRRRYLRVGFLSREPVKSTRIISSQTLGPNRVEQAVLLHGPKDVDAELLQWLSAAQRLQA
jgi:hypothetical protein